MFHALICLLFFSGCPDSIIIAGQSNALYISNITESLMDINAIDCSKGGINISEYYSDSLLYKECIKKSKWTNVKGMFFYQGESDAGRMFVNQPLNEDWNIDFERVITSFRKDLKSNIPVVYAQIGQYNTTVIQPFLSIEENKTVYNNWEKFKRIQTKVNLSDVTMIRTDDLSVVDDVHHGYEENVIVTKRFIEKLTYN
jgi:hypothetical protein